MISEEQIGKKIRQIRKSKGITLQELAKKTDFSKGYLSKLELSEKGPPVSTLIRIAEALEVKISEIFDETPEAALISLVKKKDRKIIVRNGTQFGYNYQSLAYKIPQRHMDPYLLIRPPHQKKDICDFKHRGEELMFVLEGKMEFCYGGSRFLVEEGDCLYFDANIEHHANNLGDKAAKTLMVIYTPEHEE